MAYVTLRDLNSRRVTCMSGTDHADKASRHESTPPRMLVDWTTPDCFGPSASICLQKVAGEQVNSFFRTNSNTHTALSHGSVPVVGSFALLDTRFLFASISCPSLCPCDLPLCFCTTPPTEWANHGTTPIRKLHALENFSMMLTATDVQTGAHPVA